jgi:hypothetical protein
VSSSFAPGRLRTVSATRYVTPLREGGSLPALVEADDDGLYVLKFRAAGQGPKALVAELVAGELLRACGIAVPEIVLVDLDPALGDAEPDPEIHDLIRASGGINIGLDFLPGATAFSPVAGPLPDPDLAADIVWLDALTTNPDRTVQNPNLLGWHGRLWCIDHGAALYVHHTWRDPDAHARRPFGRVHDHVLLPYASSVAAADERLAARISREVLESVIDGVPEDWLATEPSMGSPAETRAAYVGYLARRLEAPRPFVEEADRARVA